MTDIFFSYSSKDRERPVRDALAAQGFDVFWDQEVPTGLDWDRWIRDHLNKSKCALVFWSVNSIASDNVRHEATVAKQHGKLVPVMLDALTAEQFPMGLYAVQGANLGAWTGGDDDAGWIELRRTIDTLEAELVAERARRDAAERRDRTLRDQIAKEAQAQQELRRERDHALEEIDALNVRLEAAVRAGQGATAAEAERVAELERRISELEQARDAARAEATAMQKRAARAEARSAELEDNLRSAFASVEQQDPSAAPPSRAPPAAGATPSPMRLDPKPLAAAADRWPVALAFAFVVAVWAFMLGFANTQARPGLIAAGTVLLAIAALQVLRRRAVLGGSE